MSNAQYIEAAILANTGHHFSWPREFAIGDIVSRIVSDGGPELSAAQIQEGFEELQRGKVLRFEQPTGGTYRIFWGSGPARKGGSR